MAVPPRLAQQPLRLARLDVLGRVEEQQRAAEDLSASYPLIRLAPAFQLTILASGSTMKIA
jgi:hypothetical protein